LIDTALFKSLAPGGLKGGSLRSWIETHEDPLSVCRPIWAALGEWGL
jgi:hypothetical protein